MGAALLLAAVAAPAEAGFRYVPAATDGGAATLPAETGRTDPAPGPGQGDSGTSVSDPSVSGTGVSSTSVSGSSVSGPRVWRVHAGETLRRALSRWGARAGVEVLFLTDRGYRLDGAATFEGGFADAAGALFARLSHLPHPPDGALAPDGAWLEVTHRARHLPEEESGP